MSENLNPEIRVRTWLAWALLGITVSCGGAILYPVYLAARPAPTGAACKSNLKQLATATLIYLTDFDDRLPLEPWMDDMYPYVKNEDLYSCFVVRRPQRYGYAYHLKVLGKQVKNLREKEVLFFETDALGRNVVSNLAGRSLDRHKTGSNVAYIDSTARFIPANKSPLVSAEDTPEGP